PISLFQNSKTWAIKQPPIDPRFRALDGRRADCFGIVGRRANATDDGVAEALLPHVLEAGEQQAVTIPARLGSSATTVSSPPPLAPQHGLRAEKAKTQISVVW